MEGDDAGRRDYPSDAQPRKVLEHLDWAEVKEKMSGRQHSHMGGLLGDVRRTRTTWTKKNFVYPTDEGTQVVDEYREFAGLPSRERLEEMERESQVAVMESMSRFLKTDDDELPKET